MNQEYMKEKPVLPLILSMSTPMMLSMLVQSLYNIIDSIFVAKIGEDALAAVSLVYPLQNLITALTVGFGVGMNARIAFYLGAGEKEKSRYGNFAGNFLRNRAWNISHDRGTFLCTGIFKNVYTG